MLYFSNRWLPDGSGVNIPLANAEDTRLSPGSRRSSAEGNGNQVQYLGLGNPMDKGAWWATLQRIGHDLVTKQQQREGDGGLEKRNNTKIWTCTTAY